MIRNLKVLGLALMAVLALGAVAASAASAKFDSEAASTTVSGQQETEFEHKFKVEAGETECKTAKFHSMSAQTNTGPVSGKAVAGGFTSETLTIEPTYSGCKNDLLGDMTVKMNDCDYRFTAGEGIEAGTRVKGEVKIVCHAGGKIEVFKTSGVNPCKITVGEQEVKGITYHNKETGANRDVTVEAGVSGLAYTQDGIFCPGNGGKAEKAFANGTYNGNVTVKGENTGTSTPAGIWVTAAS